MQYSSLGQTGINVSRICLGTALFGLAPLEEDVPSLVDRAIDLGINFFDTANTYGNRPSFDRPGMPTFTERKSGEELLGMALKGRRQDFIVASKVGEKRYEGANGRGLSRQHIMRAIDDTLTRLQTDYLDLYYSHHPDPNTPIEETLQTMGDLVRMGKIRYFGLSNSSGWQVAEAILKAKLLGGAIPVCNQVAYSPMRRYQERELVPACEHFGISIMPFGALHGGLLSGVENTKRKVTGNQRWRGGKGAGYSVAEIEVAKRMDALAETSEHTASQLAMAWLLAKPIVSSIVTGTSRIESLDESVGSLAVTLTDEQQEELDSLAEMV